MITRKEKVIYLAALLEGEGCFSVIRRRNSNATSVRLELRMSDEDVVQWALELIHNLIPRSGDLKTHKEEIRIRGLIKPNKPMYGFRLNGEKAVFIMKEILPFMGSRRAEKIREVIQAHESRVTKSEARIHVVARSKRCPNTTNLFRY